MRDDGGDGEKAEEKAYLEIAGEARAREDFDLCSGTNKQLWWRGRGRGGGGRSSEMPATPRDWVASWAWMLSGRPAASPSSSPST